MKNKNTYDWKNDTNRKFYYVCVDCGAILLLKSMTTVKDEKQLRCCEHWLKNSKETI